VGVPAAVGPMHHVLVSSRRRKLLTRSGYIRDSFPFVRSARRCGLKRVDGFK
jgi:hypothetical protein